MGGVEEAGTWCGRGSLGDAGVLGSGLMLPR
jgi:hypothetical protein